MRVVGIVGNGFELSGMMPVVPRLNSIIPISTPRSNQTIRANPIPNRDKADKITDIKFKEVGYPG